MSRIARIVIEGIPHHVTQRGNYNQRVFFSDKNRVYYLKLIKEYSAKYQLKILFYCLMDNHVHFIVIPLKANSMSKTFDIVNAKYAQYINKKKKLIGHLWQNRFYSCPMDEQHAYVAAKYIEQNPVKAGLASEAWEWKWSSAGYHTGGQDTSGFLERVVFLPKPDKWKEELSGTILKPISEKLKWCTRAGRPFADFSLVKKLEKVVGKNLRFRRVGRPRIC